MKTAYAPSFVKDLKRLRSSPVYARIRALVFEVAPKINDLTELPQLKKLKNADNAYRIRVGDYRIGMTLEGDTLIFRRVLHRKDIYRNFP